MQRVNSLHFGNSVEFCLISTCSELNVNSSENRQQTLEKKCDSNSKGRFGSESIRLSQKHSECGIVISISSHQPSRRTKGIRNILFLGENLDFRMLETLSIAVL